MEHKLTGQLYSGNDLAWRSKDKMHDLKVGFCETCGFHHAYPYPDNEFLSSYYSQYVIPFPLHQEEMYRFAGIVRSIMRPDSSIIDIGCGKGEMLRALREKGLNNLYGTEFGSMYDTSKKLEFATILPYDITQLCKWSSDKSKTFDCTVLINVFEHVPEPVSLMRQLKSIISPGGTLIFCVPNDFNRLQLTYLNKTKRKPWFLSLPDHLNFFNLNTIDGVMTKAGYEIVRKTVQYPLELFLLQGDDYISEPEKGRICHEKRIAFENSFRETGAESDLEQLYEGFTGMGIGRDMYIIAKPILQSNKNPA
mgnify:FL=1|jgi:SAM-dependent methyltransferase